MILQPATAKSAANYAPLRNRECPDGRPAFSDFLCFYEPLEIINLLTKGSRRGAEIAGDKMRSISISAPLRLCVRPFYMNFQNGETEHAVRRNGIVLSCVSATPSRTSYLKDRT